MVELSYLFRDGFLERNVAKATRLPGRVPLVERKGGGGRLTLLAPFPEKLASDQEILSLT